MSRDTSEHSQTATPVGQHPDRSDGDLIYRRVQRADSEELLELFRRVFQADGTGERSLATWRWRFEQAPQGNQSCLAQERNGGRIVAHIGGTPHATIWEGVLRTTMECVDHMIDPHHRHALGRPSLFARLKQHWYDEFCGRDSSFLAWGFPSQDLFRVGQRFAGYLLARTVNVLWCADAQRLVQDDGQLLVLQPPRFEPDVDALWARCASEAGCAIVRDAAHLNWRYADCPHQAYTLLTVRNTSDGSLRGLSVLRSGGLAHDVVMLMELLTPVADDAARGALLSAAARLGQSAGRGSLVAWFPENTRPFEQLQESGFRVRPTSMTLAARSWDPAIDLTQVRSRFYMSFGDMDAY